MGESSTITQRNHKAGQAPDGNDTLQLSDLYKLLQSVEKSLSQCFSVIENSLMERLQLAETSSQHAYNTISDLTSGLKGVKKELAELRRNDWKFETISELRWKEYNLLFIIFNR